MGVQIYSIDLVLCYCTPLVLVCSSIDQAHHQSVVIITNTFRTFR